MNDLFLTNYTDETFLSRLKQCFKRCVSFSLSVSFIKKAGLILFEREMEEALKRGVKGRVITSTYQNFTDIESLLMSGKGSTVILSVTWIMFVLVIMVIIVRVIFLSMMILWR